MTSRTETVYSLLANAIGTTLQGRGIAVSDRSLARSLGKMRGGDLDALPDVIGRSLELAVLGGGSPHTQAFFGRNPDVVARDLCGSMIYLNDGSSAAGGLVAKAGAYTAYRRDPDLLTAEPGTLGMYTAYSNPVLVVSAHERRAGGIVAVWAMRTAGGSRRMKDVFSELDFAGHLGEKIGEGAYALLRRDASVGRVGQELVSPLDAKELARRKADAGYELK